MGETGTVPISDSQDQIVGQPQTVVLSKQPPNKLIKLGLPLAAVIIVALVAVGFILLHRHTKNSPQSVSSICETQQNIGLLKQSSIAFGDDNITKQQEVVAKIKGLKTYQNDPNCLYVIDQYYVDAGNPTDAQKYLTDFNNVYKSSQILSTALTNTSKQAVESLRFQVKTLIAATNQSRQNEIGIQ